jgi:hypothetical protein
MKILYFICILRLIIIPGVTPMVQDAKAVAINTQDNVAVSRWRESNRAVSFSYRPLSIQCFVLSGKTAMSSTYHSVMYLTHIYVSYIWYFIWSSNMKKLTQLIAVGGIM